MIRSTRLVLAFVLALVSTPSTVLAEEVTVTLPDGSREVYEVRRAVDGAEVREGAYRRLYPGGQEAAVGQYEDGARTGRWVFTRPNGERESLGTYRAGLRQGRWTEFHEDGTKRAAGKYANGERSGPWKFWTAEGEPDPANSGDYGSLALPWPDGSLFGRGETRDGLRHGAWLFTWPSGAPLFAGRYAAGQREGTWAFHHVDGTYDPLLLSGEYWRGDRLRAGGEAAGGEAEVPTPLAELPPLRPSALEGDRGPAVEELLDRLPTVPAGAAAERLVGSLVFQPRAALPRIVNRLLRLELTDRDTSILLATRWGLALRAIGQGSALPWQVDTGPAAVVANRLSILRWYALAVLTAESDEFWELDVPLGRPRSEPGKPVQGSEPGPLLAPPFPDGVEGLGQSEAARRYAGRFVAGDGVDARRSGGRFGRSRKDPARRAADAALRWLVDHQSPDGSWDAAAFGGPDYQRHGVTSLALLALLAGGHTTQQGEYREYLQRGLLWLLATQTPEGYLLDRAAFAAIYHHCIATTVVCEALAFSRSPALRARATAAVGALERARNPYGAWRYELVPVGDNDTSVTAWAVQALTAAEWSGLPVDSNAFEGGVAWVDEVTDASVGRTGYDALGSFSARTQENLRFPRELGEALTAAGLFVYGLRGMDPVSRPVMAKQAELLTRTPPVWQEPDGNDMYYWYWGAQAAHVADTGSLSAWRAELVDVLTKHQRQDGDFQGSWDPNGPWGFEAGRVYSTAICALALLAPGRFTVAR